MLFRHRFGRFEGMTLARYPTGVITLSKNNNTHGIRPLGTRPSGRDVDATGTSRVLVLAVANDGRGLVRDGSGGRRAGAQQLQVADHRPPAERTTP